MLPIFAYFGRDTWVAIAVWASIAGAIGFLVWLFRERPNADPHAGCDPLPIAEVERRRRAEERRRARELARQTRRTRELGREARRNPRPAPPPASGPDTEARPGAESAGPRQDADVHQAPGPVPRLFNLDDFRAIPLGRRDDW